MSVRADTSRRHAGAVTAAFPRRACPLDDLALTARPADAPVPPAWVGTPVGDVFGRWIRMRDDTDRGTLRQWVVELVDGWPRQLVEAATVAVVDGVLRDDRRVDVLDRVCRETSVRVVAVLLEVPARELDRTAAATTALVRALADPSPDLSLRVGAAKAVETLSIAIRACPAIRQAAARGITPDDAVANGMALLVQAHDAGHGLLAATLLAMADGQGPEDAVSRVLEHAPPILLTRRWTADGTELVVRLDDRGGTRPFGSGAHRCPAESLAPTVAATAARRLAERGLPVHDLPALAERWPSANARLVTFPGMGWRPRPVDR